MVGALGYTYSTAAHPIATRARPGSTEHRYPVAKQLNLEGVSLLLKLNIGHVGLWMEAGFAERGVVGGLR